MHILFQKILTIIAKLKRHCIAKQHLQTWSKRVRSVDKLTPTERAQWYEEEEQQWKDYYDQLL